jgi:hypothetical protein
VKPLESAAGGVGGDGSFLVYLVSSKNEERSSPDRWSGANVIETCGAPSCLWMQELTIEGRIVRCLKDLYSRRDGVSEETDLREGVGDRLKEKRELTKEEALELDMEGNAV